MRILRKLRSKQLLHRARKHAPQASQREQQLIGRLKQEFAELRRNEEKHCTSESRTWNGFLQRLAYLIDTEDLLRFLQWDVIIKSMFVSDAPWLKRELDFLKNRPDWESRWRKALIENHVGLPTPYPDWPQTSGNLIHHAYHVAQYEHFTGRNIAELQFVFEFGGGYGSMCRLFHSLGFRGRYVIFDLPPVTLLQRYFLDTVGVPAFDVSSAATISNGAACVSNLDDLHAVIAAAASDDASENLFLANWSFSECPIPLRESIVPLLGRFAGFLVSYQVHFDGIDNIEYFTQFAEEFIRQFADTAWQFREIEHLPGNHYLLGGPRYERAITERRPEDHRFNSTCGTEAKRNRIESTFTL